MRGQPGHQLGALLGVDSSPRGRPELTRSMMLERGALSPWRASRRSTSTCATPRSVAAWPRKRSIASPLARRTASPRARSARASISCSSASCSNTAAQGERIGRSGPSPASLRTRPRCTMRAGSTSGSDSNRRLPGAGGRPSAGSASHTTTSATRDVAHTVCPGPTSSIVSPAATAPWMTSTTTRAPAPTGSTRCTMALKRTIPVAGSTPGAPGRIPATSSARRRGRARRPST